MNYAKSEGATFDSLFSFPGIEKHTGKDNMVVFREIKDKTVYYTVL